MTSERIARMLGTTPAVVWRTTGAAPDGVRAFGKGPGGWTLDCDLAQVTLLDVYRAVGRERLFARGFDNLHLHCLVEKVVCRTSWSKPPRPCWSDWVRFLWLTLPSVSPHCARKTADFGTRWRVLTLCEKSGHFKSGMLFKVFLTAMAKAVSERGLKELMTLSACAYAHVQPRRPSAVVALTIILPTVGARWTISLHRAPGGAPGHAVES